MPGPQVTIEPSMAHHFRLEAWDALDDGGKLALADYPSERLQAHGRDVPEPMSLRPFGPPGELRSVLHWREPTSAPDDPAPLITRGGAAHFYPWQGGCYEWTMLLNAAESRFESEPDPAAFFAIPPEAAIRPMIRLESRA